ncbi:hypothetical protein L2E82_01533 [Cichorium intybus]|uniref:Uncharacterized protein n=1 Tax=Cichorium intybus TaxID=13427 RepID=A0ACB9GZX8_CICIN|nr:hypothetical protein L2E82_01533 [Cichorium intybus]
MFTGKLSSQLSIALYGGFGIREMPGFQEGSEGWLAAMLAADDINSFSFSYIKNRSKFRDIDCKCHSSSHRTCVSPPVAGPTTSSHAPSPCSTCLNPNRLVFDPKSADANRGIDNAEARLLVAAAEISYMSMSKAEAAAVTEADRRAKEASYTRKRAREALDHVVYLMETEKRKNVNGNKVLAMPATHVQINNNKIVAANQVSEALKSVVLKENAGGIALSEVQNKMRGVLNRNEDLGLKNESALLVNQEQSSKINHAMQENIGGEVLGAR